jgi:hypothetical protein
MVLSVVICRLRNKLNPEQVGIRALDSDAEDGVDVWIAGRKTTEISLGHAENVSQKILRCGV